MLRDLRQGRCPLCDHREVLESQVAEFGDQSVEHPMCVTYDKRWIQEGRNPRHGHGRLQLCVCRKCGYTQWFADNPALIPVGSEYRTRIIRGEEPNDPYR